MRKWGEWYALMRCYEEKVNTPVEAYMTGYEDACEAMARFFELGALEK